MADPTSLVEPIVREPGQWLEKAGLLGFLLVAVIVLGFLLFLLMRWFLRRVDATEARCEARNAELVKEIVSVRDRYEGALVGKLGENTIAMNRVADALDRRP